MNESGLNLYNIAKATQSLHNISKKKDFDPLRPGSRPTAMQSKVIEDMSSRIKWVLGGNRSGKTQLLAKELFWVFTETHPFWKRPKDWLGPITILLYGGVSKTIDEEIFDRKLRYLLEDTKYKIYRSGGTIQKLENLTNGNKIIFFSYHNIQSARTKAQGFTAHFCFFDEMPTSYKYLEEVVRRLNTDKGFFRAYFTPKVTSVEIKNFVETESKFCKVYKLSMFDNPTIDDEEKAFTLKTLETASEAYRNTVLRGDWYAGDEAVYEVPESCLRDLPPHYHSRTWRHVISVDPAASGLLGLVILAEDPRTGEWYSVRSCYLKGKAPSDLVEEVEIVAKSYNICRYIYDTEATWFAKEARKINRFYMPVYKKHSRKMDLIKNLQQAMIDGVLYISNEEIVEELSNCMWDETGERIIKASKFHLLDSLQYAIDMLPKKVIEKKKFTTGSVEQDYLLAIKRQFEKEQKEKKLAESQKKSKKTLERKRVARIRAWRRR